MSQAPMMPVWPDALLGDTLHLSVEQFGAYLLLLFATWRNNGKPLPDDDRKLARICRCSVARWRRSFRPEIIQFFDIDGDGLHQRRLEKEWDWCRTVRDKNAISGALGGKAAARANALKRHESTISERYSERGSETGSETVAPLPLPLPLRRSQEEDLNLKTYLGSAPRAQGRTLAREAPPEPPSAEDKAAVDAIVGRLRDTLGLPPSGLRNGTYDEPAYARAITEHKRDQWLNRLATFVGEALPGLPEKLAAWEAIEAARAAGSRDATPPEVCRAVDELSRLRKTSVAYAEAAE